MRIARVPLLLLLLAATVLAQDPGGAGATWKNEAYQVELEVPAGWKKTLDEPKSSGSWVDLVEFEEPRAGATLTLSYQASQYRTTDQMIEALRKQFRGDTSLAILRDETRTATSRRPKGLYLEYTMQGSAGAQHAVAAYWLHLGRRYRIYARVREVGWRTIGGDVESIVDSFTLTGRAFSDDAENFRDEPGNYEIYFPETFTIRLPARGPRVVFQSKRLGVSIFIYLSTTSESLGPNAKKLAGTLRDEGAKVTKETRPDTHPALGVETVTLEYEQSSEGSKYRYRETLIVHRDRFYRFVLAGAESSFPSGEEHYTRLVRSISFLR